MVSTKRAKVLSILVTLSMLASMFVMPLAASAAVPASNVGVTYQVQVQRIGWMDSASNGELAGTVGQALRMEAVKISLTGAPAGASIIYQTHVQSKGWMDPVSDGAIGGTVGLAKRVEAFRMTLSGLPGYEVQYEVQGQTYGWSQGWLTAANGTAIADAPVAGTTGQAKRIEALKIKVVKTAAEVAAETAADAAVTKAEASKTQADIDAAKTAIGSVQDSTAKDALTARANAIVVPTPPPAATVSSLVAVSVSTVAGTAPKLPATVTANMSDGTTKSVNVTWAAIDATKYAADGSFTVSGTITESSTLKASATVTVDTTAVSVAPVSSTIAVNATTAFKFVDSKGATVTPANAVFSITSANAATGFFSSTGAFSASAAGVYAIQAAIGSTKVTTSVTVFGAASVLSISPTTALVANGLTKETITVRVLDSAVNGNLVSNFNGNVNVVLGPNLSFGGSYTSTVAAVKGIATFDITSNGQLTSAQTQQISASVIGTSITGDLASVSLVVPVATSVSIAPTLSNIAEAYSGSSIQLTATLKDQTGTPINGGLLGGVTVALSSGSTSIANVTSPLVFAGSTATANVTYVAAGTVAINPGAVTVNGTAVTTVSVNSVSVSFAASSFASQIVATSTVPASSFAASTTGNQKIITMITDASGIVKATYTGAAPVLTIKNASGTVVTPDSYSMTFLNGVSTFNFNIQKAGSYTYAVTDPTNPTVLTSSVSGSFTVTPGAATKISDVSASVATIKADGVSTSTLSVNVLDACNNIVTNSTLAVTFAKTIDNLAVALPATATVNAVNGVASIVVTSKTTNTVPPALLTDTFSASATISSATVTAPNPASVSTQYPLTASKLALDAASLTTQSVTAGNKATFKFDIDDAYDHVVLTDNSTVVTVTLKDASGNVLGTGSATASSGVATVGIALTTSGVYSETITATASGLTAASATGTITVSSAAAASLTITPNLTSAAPGTGVIFAVGTKDKYGNDCTSGTSSVTITASSTTYGAFAGPSATWTASLVNGTTSAIWPITNTLAFGPTSFTVTATGLTSASTTVTSVYTQNPSAIVLGGAAAAAAGADQAVSIKVVDVNGNVCTTYGGNVILTVAAVSGSLGPIVVKVAGTPITANADGSYNIPVSFGSGSFTVSDQKAQSIKYTISGPATASITGVINPAAASQILMSDSGSASLKNDGSSIIKVTATLADQFGNVVGAGNGNVTFTVTTDGTNPAVPRATIIGDSSMNFVSGTAIVTIQSVAKTVGTTFTVTATTKIGTTTVTATDVITYVA